MGDALDRYLEELAWPVPEVDSWPAPQPDLDAVAVIPALKERHTLPRTLRRLQQATGAPERLEIIVVVNNGPEASDSTIDENRATVRWLDDLDAPASVQVLDRIGPQHTIEQGAPGVGAARRLGLDAALRRLTRSSANTPFDARLLLSLDADAPPDPGYLDAIRRSWHRSEGASMAAALTRYAHRWADDRHARPIALYEAWLRLYDLGFEWAGSPFIFQALGSTQVIPATTYARADGMPPMKAREDFAMIEKIIKNEGPGSVHRLQDPVVRPAGRTSERTPLGTGQSVSDLVEDSAAKAPTLPPLAAFRDLRRLNRSLEAIYDSNSPGDVLLDSTDSRLADYLAEIDGPEHATKLATHAPDAAGFVAQWHRWFDGRRTVTYTMRRAGAEATALLDFSHDLLQETAPELVGRLPGKVDSTAESIEFMELLRTIDRNRHELLDIH